MPSNPQGNGRNVALPDENRPSWRPQDENGLRNRRPLYDEDEDRYLYGRGQHWEDREHRDWDRSGRHYAGSFEDRYRERSYPEREPYGYPRDRERPNLGTGGGMHGYSQSTGYQGPGMMHGGQPAPQTQGHRGKGPANYHRSDDRLRELVCEALTDDDRVDATHVDVVVRNGEAVLTGTVTDRAQKRAAEDCAEQVSGVKDVQNNIRVGDPKKDERRP